MKTLVRVGILLLVSGFMTILFSVSAFAATVNGTKPIISFKEGSVTENLTVTLEFNYYVGVDKMAVSNYSDFRSGTGWITAKTTLSNWKLLSGTAGTRTVYVKFMDGTKVVWSGGVANQPYKASITYKPTSQPATNSSVVTTAEAKPYMVNGKKHVLTIKDGNTTKDLDVVLELNYKSDFEQVEISNYKDFKDSSGKVSSTGWIKLRQSNGKFLTTKTWKLLPGKAGTRTVYARFKKGNYIESGYKDSPYRATISYRPVSLNRGGESTGTFRTPTSGKLSSDFGKRNGDMHNGIDISGKTGTPIYASDGGRVIFSGSGKPYTGYGNIVVIRHSNGYVTYYAHNSKNLVKVGDRVYKGQKIALMGDTGQSSGTHLHFEIRKGDTPVDPMKYISLK